MSQFVSDPVWIAAFSLLLLAIGAGEKRQKFDKPRPMNARYCGRNITDRALEICHVSNRQQQGERMMMSKIALVFALAITAVAMSIPASANPKPASPSSSTSSGYDDAASNRNGW
jgi:hypothetical protein